MNVIPIDLTNPDPSVPADSSVWIQDLFGSIETTISIPTKAPTKFASQIQLYSSGGTYRLYIYDTTNQVWRYATLT